MRTLVQATSLACGTRHLIFSLVLRVVAYALLVSTGALAITVVLSLTTTDGYGCETNCGAYERTLIAAGPILALLSVALGIAAVGGWLARRRFAHPSKRR